MLIPLHPPSTSSKQQPDSPNYSMDNNLVGLPDM